MVLDIESENINQEKSICMKSSKEASVKEVFTAWTGQKWSKYSGEALPWQDACAEPEVEDKTVWSGQIWNKYV